MKLAAAFLAGAATLALASPANAALYGLVVGVDKYTGVSALRGAVNDATDIAEVLRGIGAKRVDLLIDEAAQRDALLKAWDGIIAEAVSGDTVIFSFAGHGAQEPDTHLPKDEADGFDEVFLLQAFSEADDAAFGEKIVDDELNDWAAQAEARGINVIFVFDTCHSGIPVRSIDPRTETQGEGAYSGFRFTRYSTRPTEPAAVEDPASLIQIDFGENIIALGATDESLRVREQQIAGQSRGILSWAFSRALEGAADTNKDKAIESDELVNYVRATVFDQARHRQIPQFFAPTRAVRLLSIVPDGGTGGGTGGTAASAPAGGGSALPGVTLFAATGAIDAAKLDGVEAAGDKAGADLIWDEASGDLLDTGGEVLAFGVGADRIGDAIGAQRLRRGISTLVAQGNVLDVTLDPGNGVHCAGESLVVRGRSADLNHYTAFNVTGSGEIQFLWPVSKFKDPVASPPDEPWVFETEVGEPFGSDAVVLIASDKPLEKLHAVLEFSSEVLDPLTLWGLLENALKDTRYEIAVQDIFTRASATGSVQCG